MMVLLLLVGSVFAQQPDSTRTEMTLLSQYSLQVCAQSDQCSRLWYIDQDLGSVLTNRTFGYLFDRFAYTNKLRMPLLVQACQADLSPSDALCLDQQQTWLWLLMQARHCPQPTQRFVYSQGCVCPANMVCDPCSKNDFLLGATGIQVAGIIAWVVTLICLVWSNQRTKKIETQSQNIQATNSINKSYSCTFKKSAQNVIHKVRVMVRNMVRSRKK